MYTITCDCHCSDIDKASVIMVMKYLKLFETKTLMWARQDSGLSLPLDVKIYSSSNRNLTRFGVHFFLYTLSKIMTWR